MLTYKIGGAHTLSKYYSTTTVQLQFSCLSIPPRNHAITGHRICQNLKFIYSQNYPMAERNYDRAPYFGLPSVTRRVQFYCTAGWSIIKYNITPIVVAAEESRWWRLWVYGQRCKFGWVCRLVWWGVGVGGLPGPWLQWFRSGARRACGRSRFRSGCGSEVGWVTRGWCCVGLFRLGEFLWSELFGRWPRSFIYNFILVNNRINIMPLKKHVCTCYILRLDYLRVHRQ